MSTPHDASRTKLTRSDIFRAALRIADDDGLDKLTMRRVAAELGVEAMSLYHHVPSKAALLDGMVEQVIAQTPSPDPGSADWRTALRDFSCSLREALIAHRSVIPLVASRPATTSRNLVAIESALAMLADAGFTPGDGVRAIRSMVSLVLGHVVVETAPDMTAGADGAIDPRQFPLLTAGSRDIALDSPRDRFMVGVDAMLAGFERR